MTSLINSTVLCTELLNAQALVCDYFAHNTYSEFSEFLRGGTSLDLYQVIATIKSKVDFIMAAWSKNFSFLVLSKIPSKVRYDILKDR